MKHFLAALLLAAALLPTPGFAAEKTIKLSVPGMTCASCPYIVESSISSVDGVLAVEAKMKDRSATVTFDDAVASLDLITQATANVGYPSSLLEPAS